MVVSAAFAVKEKAVGPSDLSRRVMTGAVALPLLVGATLWSPWSFWGLVAVAALGSVWEALALLLPAEGSPTGGASEVEGAGGRGGGRAARAAGLVGAALIVAWVALGSGSSLSLPWAAGLFGAVALTGLWPGGDPARRVGAILIALALVALPLALLGRLRAEAGVAWVGLIFAVTWLGDAGAYFVGRRFGRRKLAPRISPNKTVEGSIGGAIVAVALAVGRFAAVEPGVSSWWVAGVALGANVLGQLGDLWESALKRAAGVKDSGALIPGYGGMLDKFDSMCLAAPFVVVCAALVR